MAIWHEYLDHFAEAEGLCAEALRAGNEPLILEHAEPAANSIVLIHGLSDSPWFMSAVARRFFEAPSGWDVYMPLLHMHGLRDPHEMEGVSVEEWKANVRFAIETAHARGGVVSIGGLSTGGTLSAWAALEDERIDGGVFLFAGALGLHQRPGLWAAFQRWLLGSRLGRAIQAHQPRLLGDLIGDNPYRYARVDMRGGRELVKLIREIEPRLRAGVQPGGEADRGPGAPAPPLTQPLWIAHSECDLSADIGAVERLYAQCDPTCRDFFRMHRADAVPHAELVLEEDVVGGGRVLEKTNPLFDEMMKSALAFAERCIPSRS